MSQHSALFICVHNSARSQMAEEFLKLRAGGDWRIESAGFEPGSINPLVIEAMREVGVDLSAKQTQSVFDLFKQGKTFEFVTTVCEESEGGSCPIFPGMTHRLHLPFKDPSKLEGDDAHKLAEIRIIRDNIKLMIDEFVDWVESGGGKPLGDYWDAKN